MKPPQKAIVLAAGHGERMRPLSLGVPKPLLPFWGKPLLGRILEMLEAWGVEEVLINLHYLPGRIVEYVNRDYPGGLRVNFSYEPEILGTGGAVRKAEWHVNDDPFWIVNSDIIADIDFRILVRAFERVRPLAAVWLDGSRGPRTVEMERGGIVTFESRQPGTAGTYTFCGLHLVSPTVLDHIPGKGFSSIIDAYSRAIAGGEKVLGVCVKDAFWADIGTPAGYLAAHGAAKRRMRKVQKRVSGKKIRLEGFVSLGAGVKIGRGACIRDSVIMAGATIRAGARLENAIVGRNTTVHGAGRGMILGADDAGDQQLCGIVGELGWPVKRTTVEIFPVRGSDRVFTRIRCGVRSAVVVRYGRERKENERYVQNARFLKRIGLSVPDIRMYRPDERWMVVEDVGDVALLDVMDRHTAEALYGDVLDSVAVLHVRGTRLARRTGLRLEAKFSRKLYRWEHELFEEHFLTGRLGMKRDAIALLLDDLKEVSRRLLKEPGVLIHRDLQSSNIHLFEGRMVFLDFQGMRFGSSSYDLASLLCDPYAMLSERLQERLLECYADLVKARLTAVRDMFWLAAVQRLVQAIGAYSRLGAARGTERFLCYVEPALRMLERALGHVNGQCRLKQVVCYALKKEE